jgi:hypothetical protein
MQKALIENKVEFVQLFLDSGLKLQKFLNVGRLEDLYQSVSTCSFELQLMESENNSLGLLAERRDNYL